MSTDWGPKPVVLAGYGVRLEPMTEGHAEALYLAADRDLFNFMPWVPTPWDVEGFREYVRRRTEPGNWPWVVIVSDQVAGTSSMIDVKPEHRGLEIGHTWYEKSLRGTTVNPAVKFLMLAYAFEDLGAIRVQLKCDDRNERSKSAILRLGAKFEGILRNNMIMPDGHYRQTAYFSILDDEWPAVRAGLLARLEG